MGSEKMKMCPTVEELPDGWQVKQLGLFCTKIGTGATPRGGSDVYLDLRINHALVRSQNVFDRHFDSSGLAFISALHAKELRNAEVQSGDVLLNITGDGVTFGRACIVPDHVLPACVNQHVSIIRTDRRECDPGYLLSVLTHPATKGYIESFNSGGSRRAITKGHIESFEIPLPPLPTQKAIAHILGTLDDKIELNRRMNATLEGMAKAVFREWFVDSVAGGMREGWRMGCLNDLVELVIGGDWGASEPSDEENHPAFCIRGADVPSLQEGGIGKMPTRFLKRSSLEKRQLDGGDLVIEISGGTATQSTGRPILISDGLVRRSEHPLVCSNFCRIIKLKSPAMSKFVYLWLRHLYDSDEFFQFETGTTGIKNLAFTLFAEKYPLAIPPQELCEAFDRKIAPLMEQHQANGIQSCTLAALRDSLLPRLLGGELIAEGIAPKGKP